MEIIAGTKIENDKMYRILFNKQEPNKNLFIYLAYIDNIHDELLNVKDAKNKMEKAKSNVKIFNYFSTIKSFDELDILFTIYTVIRKYKNTDEIKDIIQVNNQKIIERFIYDTSGSRKMIKDLSKFKFLINDKLDDFIFDDEYRIIKLSTTDKNSESLNTNNEKKIFLKNSEIFLTKVFDPSTKVHKIKKDDIKNKSETITIPEYFILPELKCKNKSAIFFWALTVIQNHYKKL